MDISKVIIRELNDNEHAFIKQMFHQAIYVPDGEERGLLPGCGV